MRKVVHRTPESLIGATVRETTVAMLQWAEVVIANASVHAPILTGALRRSLTHSGVEVRGMILTIRVGPDATVADYARKQEEDLSLGFGERSRANGATRPWLHPAAVAAKPVGLALIAAAVKRAAKAAA